MSDILSFQDLLANFADEVFVGREEQMTLFERALTAARPPFLILAVSGQGGVGKTMLLEQFRSRAEDHGVLTALVNEDQSTIETTLARLADQFRESGHPCKTFDERYHKYRELKQQVEEDPKAPKGLLDFALQSAARITFRSLKRVPIVAEAAEVLLTPEAENVAVDQVSAIAAYVAQRFKNKDERVLLLETDQELSRHFVTDLDRCAKERRLILFFDTYEKTAPYLETWLRNLFSGKFGLFSSRILFVIAGRYPLGQAWTPFGRAIQQSELHEFSEIEARKYLESSGIVDEPQVVELLKLSGRLPVLLALLTSVPGNAPIEVSKDAVERFLQGATAEQREVALAASVTRFFNRDILAVLLAPEVVDGAFEWLAQAAFVRSGEAGWAYHEVVRSLMLRYFRLRSAKEWVATQGKLAEYYASQIQSLGLSADSAPQNEVWRKYKYEYLYHFLAQNPEKGLIEFFNTFLISFVVLETNEKILQVSLREYTTIISQAAEATNDITLITWADRTRELPQRLADLNDSSTAQTAFGKFFSLLVAIETLGKYERSLAFWLRGRSHYNMQSYELAIADFSKAIELQSEGGHNYYWRGLSYFWIRAYELALADLNKVMKLEAEAGYYYYWRGRTHYEAKTYELAITDLSRAIELPPKIINSYYWRGLSYYQKKSYELAITDLSIGIELAPDGYHYAWRGLCHYRVKSYELALVDLSKAIELRPESGHSYAWRGRTYLVLNNIAMAQADFAQIEGLSESGRLAYAVAGGYAELTQVSEGCRWLRRAFEQENSLVERVRTDPDFDHIQEMAEFQALLAEFG